jgi:hypothetical protein
MAGRLVRWRSWSVRGRIWIGGWRNYNVWRKLRTVKNVDGFEVKVESKLTWPFVHLIYSDYC